MKHLDRREGCEGRHKGTSSTLVKQSAESTEKAGGRHSFLLQSEMVSSRISPSEGGGSMVNGDGNGADRGASNKRHSGGIGTRQASRRPGEANSEQSNHNNNNHDDSKRKSEKDGNNGTSPVASAVLATSSTKSRERKHHRRRRHRHGSKDAGATDDSNGADTPWGADGGGQEDKFKLLVEFIPYVGLGDATRDNMVRRFALTQPPNEASCLDQSRYIARVVTMKKLC